MFWRQGSTQQLGPSHVRIRNPVRNQPDSAHSQDSLLIALLIHWGSAAHSLTNRGDISYPSVSIPALFLSVLPG